MNILHTQRNKTAASQVKQPDSCGLYKVGFDPGSRYCQLFLAPADDPERMRYAIIPSWVSSGTLEEIGRRSRLVNADLADQLA